MELLSLSAVAESSDELSLSESDADLRFRFDRLWRSLSLPLSLDLFADVVAIVVVVVVVGAGAAAVVVVEVVEVEDGISTGRSRGETYFSVAFLVVVGCDDGCKLCSATFKYLIAFAWFGCHFNAVLNAVTARPNSLMAKWKT